MVNRASVACAFAALLPLTSFSALADEVKEGFRLAQQSSAPRSTAADRCNAAAASRLDPSKPRNVPGLADDDVTLHVALEACREAVEKHPEIARL